MKKLFILLGFFVTIVASAQAPQGFNYQATVRNSAGQLLLNQSVLVKFTILQNNDPGIIVYSENQSANTDDLGHINLVVGQGTAIIGFFSTINWGSGLYYLGIDLNTGSGFVSMGTTQLLSVPYALYAANSGSSGPQGPQGLAGIDGINGIDGAIGPQGPQGPAGQNGLSAYEIAIQNGYTGTEQQWLSSAIVGSQGPQGLQGEAGATGPQGIQGEPGSSISPTYTIGLWPELGGYVFRISSDGKHGLVCETIDQGTSEPTYSQDLISNPNTHSVDGAKFMDWRLPTKYEAYEMYIQRSAIGNFQDLWYWTSVNVQGSSNYFWLQHFGDIIIVSPNNQRYGDYSTAPSVRAVRSF